MHLSFNRQHIIIPFKLRRESKVKSICLVQKRILLSKIGISEDRTEASREDRMIWVQVMEDRSQVDQAESDRLVKILNEYKKVSSKTGQLQG